MRKNIFNLKQLWINLIITLIWFSALSGSSEINCLGDPFGKGFGNFVLWNMPDPTTSLSTIVDVKYFFIDFGLSYIVTLLLLFLTYNIFKIKNSLLIKTKWLFIFSILGILISGFFSLEFFLGVNLNQIDCLRIEDTYHFGLRFQK